MTDTLIQGGPILWLIFALGIIAVGVFLERSLQLHRDRIDSTDFLRGIFNLLRRGNESEAIALCEETPGPVARLASLAIRRRELPRDRMIEELDRAGLAETERMERRLTLLAILSQTAPLLGLLGVAIAIVKALVFYRGSFPNISTGDFADFLIPGALAVAAGLLVAIPCHLGFNLLVLKIDRLVLDMRDAVSELVHFFEKPTHG